MMRKLFMLLLVMALPLGSAMGQPAPDNAAGPDNPKAGERKHQDSDDKDARRGHARRRDRAPRLSESDADEVLQIIARLNPELGEQLTTLRGEDPDQFARELNQRFPRYHWLLRLKKYDAEMYELRVEDVRLWRQSRELAEQVRGARDADKTEEAEALREQLRAVVAEHFTLRQAVREAELTRLERRLDELKAQLKERAEKRDEMIAEHTHSLIEGRRDGDDDDRGREGSDDRRGSDRD